MGVGGDHEAVVVRRLDDRPHLLFRELRVLAALGQAEDAAGGGDLDQVGALLVALPDRLARVRDAVDDALPGAGVAGQIRPHAVRPVAVAAGGGQGDRGREDPRPRHLAPGDRVAHGENRRRLAAHVAHRREAGHQRPLRVDETLDRQVRRVLLEAVQVRGGAGLLRSQVDVHVHQAGQDRVAGKVDQGVAALRIGEPLLDGRDALAFDDDRVPAEDLAGLDVDQGAGVDHGATVGSEGGG